MDHETSKPLKISPDTQALGSSMHPTHVIWRNSKASYMHKRT